MRARARILLYGKARGHGKTEGRRVTRWDVPGIRRFRRTSGAKALIRCARTVLGGGRGVSRSRTPDGPQPGTCAEAHMSRESRSPRGDRLLGAFAAALMLLAVFLATSVRGDAPLTTADVVV